MGLFKAHHPHHMDHGRYKSHIGVGAKDSSHKTVLSDSVQPFGVLRTLISRRFVICLYNLTMLNLKPLNMYGVRVEKKFNPLTNYGRKTSISISVHDTCSYNVKCGDTFGFNSLFMRGK